MSKDKPIIRAHHVWLLVVCLLISAAIAGSYYYMLVRRADAEIASASEVYATRTTDYINSVFHKTDTLAAVVKMKNGDIDEETFQTVAKIVYEENRGIRGIQYMPGAVVTYSYPLEGNEAVMGKNFFDIPERRDDVMLAINTHSIALSGPYNLIQGGLGLVARNPVFLTDDDGNEYFWGFSTIVLDLPDALGSVGLSNLSETGYDFQLFSTNENGERLVIEGNENLDVSTATCSAIQVPHHEWTLAIKQLNPWQDPLKALLAFAVCVLVSLVIWHRYRIGALEKATIALRERFFSDVSHDMRTPLNAVINFSEMGQEPGLSPQQKDAYFKKIQTSGALLLELVNETLTISKAESGSMYRQSEPTDLRKFIDDSAMSVHTLAAERDITFDIDLAGLQTSTVLVDRVALQKTLLNLLSNAVKYTPEGGHVALTAKDSEDGKNIVLSVKDDGIGIGEDFLPHLFEPFAQEQRSDYGSTGTGLGLSIVQQMVRLMGGTITVNTRKNEGSEFVVSLPLQHTDLPAVDQETIQAGTSNVKLPAGLRVLICEDNALNQEIACALLEEQGAQTVSTANGKEGVEAFRASDPHSFDAILMDVRMPVMDGLEATRAIRALDRPDAATVPIVAMTADAFESDIQHCLDAGMNAHVAKPIDAKTLFRVLAGALDKDAQPRA